MNTVLEMVFVFPLIPLPIIEAISKKNAPALKVEKKFPLIPLPIIEAIYKQV